MEKINEIFFSTINEKSLDEIFNKTDDLLIESQKEKIRHLVEYFMYSMQADNELAIEQNLKVS